MEIRETILTYLREECFISPNTGGFGNYGCMDPLAYNYDWQATDPCGSVIPDPLGGNCAGDTDWNGPGTSPGDCCCGCKDPMADNYCVNCVGDCDGCGYPPPTPLGLGDPTSCCNYPTPILGCTDPTACNYISTANTDDGSCEYNSCLGCTDTTAANYTPSATIDDGSCTYGITGCTDTTACNYDATATIDDGSCVYCGIVGTNIDNYDASVATANCDTGCLYCKEPTNVSSYGSTSSLYIGINWDYPVFPTSIPPLSATVNKVKIKWREQGMPSWNSTVVTSIGSGLSDSHTITSGLINGATYQIKIRSVCDNSKSAWVHTTQTTMTEDLSGCTDSTAFNYDANATIDDGSCTYTIPGCTDPLAFNYDATATIDDGSCKYKPLECKDLEKGCWVCKDPINFPSCQQITTATQLTSTLSYGLAGFPTQQDCVNNTPCGRTDNNTPCGKLDNYVMINYANWQGMGPLDTIHFCEKCKYNGLNDPMCKCCKEDPCNKISFMTNVKNEFNLEIDEFCKYCKSGRGNEINNELCRCCKRFEKTK
tara:strand:- start:1679 stop:3298 length:1620 start_codon:yes stop_codon:yes gene_type:complete